MKCTYTLTKTGEVYDSYAELMDYIDMLVRTGRFDLDNIDDIVYSSRHEITMQRQVEDLQRLKATYVPRIGSDEFSPEAFDAGEPTDANEMTILNFLDHPDAMIEGRRLVTQLNREEYRVAFINDMMDKNMTREQAEAIFENTMRQWNTIQRDSMTIHSVITSPFVYNGSAGNEINFAAKLQNNATTYRTTSFKDNAMILARELLGSYKPATGLRGFYTREKGRYAGARVVTNVNLTSKLANFDKTLLGHIDYIIVDATGGLHLYVFKTTSMSPNKWQIVKERKYKYQLAFLRRMLANNGVNVARIDLNIVPVELKYNDDYTKIEHIQVHNARCYSYGMNGVYVMSEMDADAATFIDAAPQHLLLTVDALDEANKINRAIFPSLNITTQGLEQSALQLIAHAPEVNADGRQELVIKWIGDKGHSYDVTIKGKTYAIENNKPKLYNEEIINLVKEHVDEIRKNMGASTERVHQVIYSSFKQGIQKYNKDDINWSLGRQSLDTTFSKYIPEKDKDGNIQGDWEYRDDLDGANIMLFIKTDKITKTKTLDVVSLTAFDINARINFAKGDNILGSYLTSQQYNGLESNYGNIEMVRVMTLLNALLPSLPSDIRLGTLKIMSVIGECHSAMIDIGEFNRLYYTDIIQHMRKLVPGIDFQNNFRFARFVDPAIAIFEEYNDVVNTLGVDPNEDTYGFKQLDPNSPDQTVYGKIKKLLNIQESILKVRPDFNNPSNVEKAIIQSKNVRDRNLATLYNMVTRAYLNYTGGATLRATKWDEVRALGLTAFSQEDDAVRLVSENLQMTHDAIASEFLQLFDTNIRKWFTDYYKEIGYTSAENMIIGDQRRVYRNLLDPDPDKPLSFKNPYDMSNDLTAPERKLLKHVLYQIYSINHNGLDLELKSEHDDEKIRKYIERHDEYLWMPLERASRATRRFNIDAWKAKMRNWFRQMRHTIERFDEFMLNQTAEERLYSGDDQDFYSMSLTNPFWRNMPNVNSNLVDVRQSRAQMIAKYGRAFFEYNLENIMIDYLTRHISTLHLNKLLIGTKALLLQLQLTGTLGGNEKIVRQQINYIHDYLKVNVFKTSIMSKTSKAIVSRLAVFRKFATDMLLGGNFISMFRDSVEGLTQTFVRTAIKLNTDIDAKSLAKAYWYVTKHATSNAMAANLLSKLCLKYRLANTDVGRIAERAKSSRNGLFNYDTWLYGTLRTPDFMNRMALFVARCMHDGIWDAYSIDENNNLVYDWKKDKRFTAFANGSTSDPDYNKQKALYYSIQRQYNLEHPDNPVNPGDDLKAPYSDTEIRNIQSIADNIFGAYDRSKKAMFENYAVGWTFGMFFTWMNGIVNNYWAKPHRGVMGRMTTEQEIDEGGNLLWFNEDGSVTTSNTGLPVYKNIPMIVQGIIPTMIDMYRILRSDGFSAMRMYAKGDIQTRANLRKLFSDILMAFLLTMLFRGLDKEYKEYKADMENNPIMQNLVTEIIYKGAGRSYDQFKGPVAVLTYFADDMNPPLFAVPKNTVMNTYNFLTGHRNALQVLGNFSGLTRSGKDTINAYRKSLKDE